MDKVETVIDTARTRLVFSIYHLVLAGTLVASAAVAWAAIASHVSSDGHPELTKRVENVEDSITEVALGREADAKIHAVQAAYQNKAIDDLARKVDRLTEIAAAQLAAQPVGPLRTTRARARAERIRANVAAGADPLDGL